jgi:hypothetical protein
MQSLATISTFKYQNSTLQVEFQEFVCGRYVMCALFLSRIAG